MATARHLLVPSLLALALSGAIGSAQAQPGPSGPDRPAFGAGDREGPPTRTAGAIGHARAVAIHRDATRTQGLLRVRSPQIEPQAPIPARHTAYGDDISPVLQWDAAPGARAYALLVEDPDAPGAQPFVHWVAWNIPPEQHALPEGIATVESPRAPAGMKQGVNDAGRIGYFGPRPPPGPPHRYHFQVFALDRPLDLAARATREDLLRAIEGHVIAKGELVATSQAPGRH